MLHSIIIAQPTPYELGNGNQSTTYAQCLQWYHQLAATSPLVQIDSIGLTDIGLPLHAIIISKGHFDPITAKAAGKAVVLINNGIHPGETEGIDASMQLARELAHDNEMQKLLNQLVIIIIPIFNVDGSLLRNNFTRANQNGPEQYGFRGNARNLDLNRDFAKLDSRNTQALVQFSRSWEPELYLETHTTNGADYQHIMTLIETQKDKLQGPAASWMSKQFSPALYAGMQAAGLPMTPYVNTIAAVPDSGIIGFLDGLRYGSGHMAAFGTLAYVLETHMLKPYNQRYQATYELLNVCLQQAAQKASELRQMVAASRKYIAEAQQLPLNWQLQPLKADTIEFLGYHSAYKASNVHQYNRLYYDRSRPQNMRIPFYNHFEGIDSCQKPRAYLIPQAWGEIIQRLQLNRIPLSRLQADTTLFVERQRIVAYETVKNPYEGHYLHTQVAISPVHDTVLFRAGDYVVPMGYPSDHFVMQLLEAPAADSYFNWNFFDSILQQKEYYSSYVFEDTAAELLAAQPQLSAALEAWKAEQQNPPTARMQLDFLYPQSGMAEPGLRILPIARQNQ